MLSSPYLIPGLFGILIVMQALYMVISESRIKRVEKQRNYWYDYTKFLQKKYDLPIETIEPSVTTKDFEDEN